RPWVKASRSAEPRGRLRFAETRCLCPRQIVMEIGTFVKTGSLTANLSDWETRLAHELIANRKENVRGRVFAFYRFLESELLVVAHADGTQAVYEESEVASAG